ncbi:hypothetical protein VCHC56A1_2201, partial [Vibrio cholerae HC-56A1]
MMNAR